MVTHPMGKKMNVTTDVSGKWVPIQEVLKLLEKIQELEKQIYGGR
jgi:hypothetical protein